VKDPSTFYERSLRTGSGARIDKLIAEPANLHFIGEQDGPAERDLKGRLTRVFEKQEVINLAYLATIQYSDEDTRSVALCLRCLSAAAAETAACAASDVFFKMFGKGQRLDIIVLDDDAWRELRAVCKPFYVRAVNNKEAAVPDTT
jgi:hypothetical protein